MVVSRVIYDEVVPVLSIDMMSFYWSGQRTLVSSHPKQHHARSISTNHGCTLQSIWMKICFCCCCFCWVVWFPLKKALYFPNHYSRVHALGNMCDHNMFWQALISATCLTAVSKAVSSSTLSLLHKDNMTIKCEIKRPFREQWHLLEVCLLASGWIIFKLSERTVTGSKAT